MFQNWSFARKIILKSPCFGVYCGGVSICFEASPGHHYLSVPRLGLFLDFKISTDILSFTIPATANGKIKKNIYYFAFSSDAL